MCGDAGTPLSLCPLHDYSHRAARAFNTLALGRVSRVGGVGLPFEPTSPCFFILGTAGVAGDAIATKIVELAKRNRVLMAESEAAKSRVKQLRNRVQELEQEVRALVTSPSGALGRPSRGGATLRCFGSCGRACGPVLPRVPQSLSRPERGKCVGSRGARGHAEAAGTAVGTWTCGLTARVRTSAPSLTQCGTLSTVSVLCASVSPTCHAAVITVLTRGVLRTE